ncbi:MAG: transposase [Burkholderiales bacterium]|nr:transposase [Burkholderiales bacterium]
MARLPRLSIPGYPHHVIQRGNNRQAIFLRDADRQRMLDLLEDHAQQNEVAVHAYVLMDNHFHLLLTPQSSQGLSRLMQAVGRRYVRHFNDAHGRSGTLWEGRYRSTLIETERYLLACMAYIDLNPVRSGLVVQARDFSWSSHTHYAGLRADRLVTPHPLYWELGNTPFAREAAYARLVQEGLSLQLQQELTDSALRGWVLGGPDFLAMLQKKTERRLSKASAGRPASSKTSPD